MIFTIGYGRTTFSPLFIAAWSATQLLEVFATSTVGPFSPLFIAAWSATQNNAIGLAEIEHFQSAFHRGMECNNLLKLLPVGDVRLSVRFSSRHGVQPTSSSQP